MNSGLKRMFKYMFVYAERICLAFVVFVAAWFVYMLLLSGGFSDKNILVENLSMIPNYVIFLGVLVGMIFTTGYLPLLSNGHLSMGATRREFAYGIIFAHLIVVVESSLVGTIINLIVGRFFNVMPAGKYAALAFTIYFISTGIGFIMALLVERFGKVAYYIFVAIIAILAGVIGGFTAAAGVRGSIEFFVSNKVYILPVIGLVFFALTALGYRLALRKKTVSV